MLVAQFGCAGRSSAPFQWQDESVDLVWPEAPDKPRVKYLRSLHGLKDFKSAADEPLFRWLLGEQEEELPLLSPFAVATTRSGLVWVADNGARALFRIDLGRQEVEFFLEIAGVKLNSPSGVAVDEEAQRVYLADAANRKVFLLDFDGTYLDSWAPAEGFKRPAGLAVDPGGRLLVADALGGAVYLFDRDGKVLKTVRSRLSTDGSFQRPLNVAFGPNGEILVLDALAFRVEVQDARGELLGTIGKHGDSAGYMARPKGLAVDGSGHVFVSDSAFDNIQIFDLAGNLLMYFGKAGGGAGQFNLPAGLFVDTSGRVFAADSYNHRVQVFQMLQEEGL